MTTSITSNVASTASPQSLKQEQIQEKTVQVFMVDSQEDAEQLQIEIQTANHKNVADSMIQHGRDEENKANNTTGIWAGIGTGGGVAIGALAAFLIPGVGWGAGIAIALFGGVLGGGTGGAVSYSMTNEQRQAGKDEQEKGAHMNAVAQNNYAAAQTQGETVNKETSSDYITVEGLRPTEADITNTVNNPNSAYTVEEIQNHDIYIINPPSDGKTHNSKVQVVKIDSNTFDGESFDPAKGGVRGYEKNEYEVRQQYATFLADFVDISGEDAKLSTSEADRFEDITNALQTVGEINGRNEDAKFFDVTGDGKINLADVSYVEHSKDVDKLLNNIDSYCEYLANSKPQELENMEKEEYIESTFTIQGLINYINGKAQSDDDKISIKNVIAAFDVNGDGKANMTDLEYFKGIKEKASNDINNDGIVDSKDSKILNSYLQANKQIVIDNEIEIDAIKETFGGEDCFNAI